MSNDKVGLPLVSKLKAPISNALANSHEPLSALQLVATPLTHQAVRRQRE